MEEMSRISNGTWTPVFPLTTWPFHVLVEMHHNIEVLLDTLAFIFYCLTYVLFCSNSSTHA
jgi:hypothetical protein